MLAYRHIKYVGAHIHAFDGGVIMAPLDSRYTQAGFNLDYVKVCVMFVIEIQFESLLSKMVFRAGNKLVITIGGPPTIFWRLPP